MPFYDFRCKCGKIQEVEAHMGEAPTEVSCDCGGWAKRIYTMPLVMFNKWNPDLRFNDVSDEIDGERDAIACGAYE